MSRFAEKQLTSHRPKVDLCDLRKSDKKMARGERRHLPPGKGFFARRPFVRRDQFRITTDPPPSIASAWPVTWREASEAKNTTGPLMSYSPPARPSGVTFTISLALSASPADSFVGK